MRIQETKTVGRRYMMKESVAGKRNLPAFKTDIAGLGFLIDKLLKFIS